MKKLTLIIAIVFTATIFCLGQGPVELIYDNDEYTDWQGFTEPEMVFAVRMSPTSPCEVQTLKYYAKKDGVGEPIYVTTIYEWEGTQPATNAVFENISLAIGNEGWKEVPLDETITFDGDFVVGFTASEANTFMAYDANLQTGRNWVLDVLTLVWTEMTEHSYLIRAVVQYEVGVTEELIGTPIMVYPNPATDVIHIEADMKVESVSIMNTIGQVVYTEFVGQKSTKINLSNYDTGIYFVRMETDGETITKKIMVE